MAIKTNPHRYTPTAQVLILKTARSIPATLLKQGATAQTTCQEQHGKPAIQC